MSYHIYVTGQTDINAGMNWNTCIRLRNPATKGELSYYKKIYNLVRAGLQPNAGPPRFMSQSITITGLIRSTVAGTMRLTVHCGMRSPSPIS